MYVIFSVTYQFCLFLLCLTVNWPEQNMCAAFGRSSLNGVKLLPMFFLLLSLTCLLFSQEEALAHVEGGGGVKHRQGARTLIGRVYFY